MKKSSTHRGSTTSITQSKSSYNISQQNQNLVDGSQSSRSTSNNAKSSNNQQQQQLQWTPDRAAVQNFNINNLGISGGNSNWQALMGTQLIGNQKVQSSNQSQLNAQAIAALTKQIQSRSPLVKDTTNTSYTQDVSLDRSQKRDHSNNASVSPLRTSNVSNQQNVFYPNQSQNISRNQSHRSSSSNSFVNLLNKTAGMISQNNINNNNQNQQVMQAQSSSSSNLVSSSSENISFKEKEKKYQDKIKQMKLENKKLCNLLEESEKLFYGKLQETKKESQSMSSIIKHIWPLIKNKKEVQQLLKNANIQQFEEQDQLNQNYKQQKVQIESLEAKLLQYKKREKDAKEQLEREMTMRIKAEHKIEKLKRKLKEKQAYEQTVKSYMHDSRNTSSYRMRSSSNNRQQQTSNSGANMRSSDISTKPSSNIQEHVEEPVPSFLKAANFYPSHEQSVSDENDFLNETFSKSSGNVIGAEDQRRFSDMILSI